MKKLTQYTGLSILLALSNHLCGQMKVLDSLAFGNTIYGIDMSVDQKKLFIAGKDSIVYITSISGKITHELKGHTSSVSSVDFYPEKGTILSGSYDNSAILWDESGRLITRLLGHDKAVIKVSQSDKLLATASRDKSVKVWDRNGEQIFTLNHDKQVNDLFFVEDKNWIVTAGFDKTIKIWDYQGNLFQSISLASGIRSIYYAESKELLIAGHMDGSISMVKPNGEILQVITAHGVNDEEYKMINSIAVSNDESYFISGSADGFVKVWNFDGELLFGRKLSKIKHSYVSGIRLIGNKLVTSSGGGDNYTRVWKMEIFRPGYPCQNSNYEYLSRIIGKWEVQTKDRLRPGEYENNTGIATIEPLIDGCGISIRYRGFYRSKSYAREISITGQDSTIQMVALDSEHGKFSLLEGSISNGILEVIWFRNKEVGRLRSKYVMTFKTENSFEFSSYLTTDYAETWSLTHQRIYKRIK
ncbi:WD40 repeat domain-containing protein [Ekhidna sp.]|uniref:WD40 repeat domain-containing protein n=1 Tax=Ekhidna sp. TaxID=2608089 RepID=UPI00329871F0